MSPCTINFTQVSGACPSDKMLSARRNAARQEVTKLLHGTVTPWPILDNRYGIQPPCGCSGPGQLLTST